jgi:predicted enzyme related to lactoylglutathione lyase
MAGQVVHFEVPADDLDRASRFYSEAFGWRLRAIPGMNYTLVSTSETGPDGAPAEVGAINGGMLRRGAPVTAPIVTVQVDDIDAALAAVERLGGTVALGRQQVGDMGFSAYFVDTEGNTLGLWQNAS